MFGNSQAKLHHFLRMSQYFGVYHGTFLLKVAQIAPPEVEDEEAMSDDYFLSIGFVTNKLRTLYLKPEDHNTQIKGYEVDLGADVSRFQVGWLDPDTI